MRGAKSDGAKTRQTTAESTSRARADSNLARDRGVEKERRIQYVRGLMARLEWKCDSSLVEGGGPNPEDSAACLAAEWGCSRSTVQQYAAEASRRNREGTNPEAMRETLGYYGGRALERADAEGDTKGTAMLLGPLTKLSELCDSAGANRQDLMRAVVEETIRLVDEQWEAAVEQIGGNVDMVRAAIAEMRGQMKALDVASSDAGASSPEDP